MPIRSLSLMIIASTFALNAQGANDVDSAVEEIFGDRLKQVRASISRLDDVALAGKILESAKQVTDQPQLLTALCKAAGQLGSGHSTGFATAMEAYELVQKHAPDHVAAIESAWIDLLFRQTRMPDKAIREIATGKLLRLLMDAADRLSASGKSNEAIAQYRRALIIARRPKHPQADAIENTITEIQERQQQEARVTTLEEKILRDASDQQALVELATLLIVELDKADDAKPYVARVTDAAVKERLTLLVKPMAGLTGQQLMTLGVWFQEEGEKLRGKQKLNKLRRAYRYLDHFLTTGGGTSFEKTKAKLVRDRIEAKIKAAGHVVTASKPTLTFTQYRGGKISKPSIASSDGFCFITRMGGGWRGLPEMVNLTINPQNKWHIAGYSGNRAMNWDVATLDFGPRKLPQLEYQTHKFKNQQKVKLIHSKEGFCILSKVSGKFEGAGEETRVFIHEDGFWYLFGRTQQPFGTQAISIKFPKTSRYSAKVTETTWRRGNGPIKLIHKDKGFAYLSGMGGHAGSGQEQADLSIDEKDDHWWLRPRSGNRSFYVRVTTIEDLKW